MNKNLKQFIKNHNRILQLQEIFQGYGRLEIAKRFTNLENFDFSTNQGSIQIGLNNINYCDIDKAIINLEIINPQTIKLIKENINENDSFEHSSSYIFEGFGESVEDFNKRFYFKNKKNIEQDFEFDGWRYDSSCVKSKLFELDNKFNYQDFAWRNLEYLTKINNYQDLIQNVRIYKSFDSDIICGQKAFLIDSLNLIKDFVYNLRSMLKAIEFYNEEAETAAQDQLENDIEEFIENHNLLKAGDVEKLKFDFIAKIEGEEITTNKGAKAPLDDCKKALEVFKSGGNLEGLKLGIYTINKIFNIKENVFFRAGCHLIKIDNHLINQLA
jgi:hypothetical protein